jgi:hypothetical protein
MKTEDNKSMNEPPMITLSVHIPNFGWTTTQNESIEKEMAELEAKYPQHKGNIIVKLPSNRKLSDTEIAALDE